MGYWKLINSIVIQKQRLPDYSLDNYVYINLLIIFDMTIVKN